MNIAKGYQSTTAPVNGEKLKSNLLNNASRGLKPHMMVNERINLKPPFKSMSPNNRPYSTTTSMEILPLIDTNNAVINCNEAKIQKNADLISTTPFSSNLKTSKMFNKKKQYHSTVLNYDKCNSYTSANSTTIMNNSLNRFKEQNNKSVSSDFVSTTAVSTATISQPCIRDYGTTITSTSIKLIDCINESLIDKETDILNHKKRHKVVDNNMSEQKMEGETDDMSIFDNVSSSFLDTNHNVYSPLATTNFSSSIPIVPLDHDDTTISKFRDILDNRLRRNQQYHRSNNSNYDSSPEFATTNLIHNHPVYESSYVKNNTTVNFLTSEHTHHNIPFQRYNNHNNFANYSTLPDSSKLLSIEPQSSMGDMMITGVDEQEILSLFPTEILYTADCIHPYFRNGKYLPDTFHEIISGRLKVADLEPIRVVLHKERFWAISGNRRLYLFKKLEAFGLINCIKAIKIPFVELYFYMKLTSRNGGMAVFVHSEPFMDQKLDQLVIEAMQGPWDKITSTHKRALRLELRNSNLIADFPNNTNSKNNCLNNILLSSKLDKGIVRETGHTGPYTSPNLDRATNVPSRSGSPYYDNDEKIVTSDQNKGCEQSFPNGTEASISADCKNNPSTKNLATKPSVSLQSVSSARSPGKNIRFKEVREDLLEKTIALSSENTNKDNAAKSLSVSQKSISNPAISTSLKPNIDETCEQCNSYCLNEPYHRKRNSIFSRVSGFIFPRRERRSSDDSFVVSDLRWRCAKGVCGGIIALLTLSFIGSIIHVARLIFKTPGTV